MSVVGRHAAARDLLTEMLEISERGEASPTYCLVARLLLAEWAASYGDPASTGSTAAELVDALHVHP